MLFTSSCKVSHEVSAGSNLLSVKYVCSGSLRFLQESRRSERKGACTGSVSLASFAFCSQSLVHESAEIDAGGRPVSAPVTESKGK